MRERGGCYPALGRVVTVVFIIPLGIMWLVMCALRCGARLSPISENSCGKRIENYILVQADRRGG